MDRILVVDDSSLVRAMLVGWLRAGGYEAEVAASATEALACVASEGPDLILLDLMLPDTSGVEVCRQLKSSEETTRIPVVILTAAGSTENRVRCLELGADDFLTKPVVREELIARVRSLLRAKRLSDRLLMSYMELDKLGTLAEAFTSQSIADWSAVEVADRMARHLLGPTPESSGHPHLAWAGVRVRTRMVGASWYFEAGAWKRVPAVLEAEALAEALAPHATGDGHYVCKTGVPPRLRGLLRMPSAPEARNFVAIWSGDNVVLTASYPWEVGSYELPLLRAVLRHWRVFERIRHEANQAEQAFFATMEALALAAEFYDSETAGHIRRVGAYARILAEGLGRDARFVKWMGRSAPMHDVGKITIPIDLVRKPSLLAPEEMSAMRRHTVQGAGLLAALPPLDMAREIARSHHESFDGSGYPDGLRGEDIPFAARIVKVIDVYDALRTPRPYKPGFDHDDAIARIRGGDEKVVPEHFDPTILAAFLDRHREMEGVFESMRDVAPTALAPLAPLGSSGEPG